MRFVYKIERTFKFLLNCQIPDRFIFSFLEYQFDETKHSTTLEPNCVFLWEKRMNYLNNNSLKNKLPEKIFINLFFDQVHNFCPVCPKMKITNYTMCILKSSRHCEWEPHFRTIDSFFLEIELFFQFKTLRFVTIGTELFVIKQCQSICFLGFSAHAKAQQALGSGFIDNVLQIIKINYSLFLSHCTTKLK